MQFREFGLMLFVEHYEECTTFYRDLLQLEVRNEKETLVAFELPNGYLMVEQGGVGSEQEKSRKQNPTVLRFDVESLSPIVERLEERGVHFSKKGLKFDWGTIAVFNDPDGNRIELGEINSSSGSYT
ncbi:VOC family protein [Virgibacillus necropolis]|uniref:Glyoxalase/bleomycin resistance/dioxygenase family protein n=1 Tax=Virgibacillus necropolis TaxID=163877 RepID=A0A221MDA9_9BACI|nr:VOC family protein [Virgibacillus necropolis]ASN05627.1 glyoxalase/bleomycin resistance/dioxygenase family protein [Virgibacillus necropolis]